MEVRVASARGEGELEALRQRTTLTWRCCASSGSARGQGHLSRREAGSDRGHSSTTCAGLAPRRRRVAHDDPAGRRHVQERPDAEEILVDFGSGCRRRSTTAHSPRVRGNRGQAVHVRTPGRTSSSERSASPSSSSAPPGSSTRRSASARPRARSTTSWRRSRSGSIGASARSSRR
jgi:hypothetical protein